jgi:hypothetical protein
MFVAIAALVFATAGSAVAASLITSKQIKDGTIQTRDISKKARTQLKGKTGAAGPRGPAGPKGDVGAKGETGASGASGASGAKGTDGTDGAPGTARAYANIDPGACSGAGPVICTPLKQKNITAVERVSPGSYCITVTGANPSTDLAMAGVDYRYSSGPEGLGVAMSDETNTSCNTGFGVLTRRNSVAGGALLSSTADDVAFWFAVP